MVNKDTKSVKNYINLFDSFYGIFNHPAKNLQGE